MEHSMSYLLLEVMLPHDQLQMEFSEFEKLVDFMKLQELITAQEQQALLEFARNTTLNE